MAHPSNRQATVAGFIADHLRLTSKSEGDIAAECGFASPTTLSLISAGQMKLPFSHLKALARALGADHVQLLNLALAEYLPEVSRCIEECSPALINPTDLSAAAGLAGNGA